MEGPIEKKRPKGTPLLQIFSAVPPRYDLMNRLFTWRLDERWRKMAARECLADNPRRVLDLGTGTGDLALHLARRAGRRCLVSALDFSRPMLEEARRKARKQGMGIGAISFIEGDAANLPFPSGRFDAVGTAFAFRNLAFRNPRRGRFLDEIRRVIRPGGRFVVVESSQPSNPVIRKLSHLYISFAAGKIGGFLSGQHGAYRYLAHSAINFFTPAEVEEMLKSAGFVRTRHTLLLGGAAAITVAIK